MRDRDRDLIDQQPYSSKKMAGLVYPEGVEKRTGNSEWIDLNRAVTDRAYSSTDVEYHIDR